jgi:carbamate kinase
VGFVLFRSELSSHVLHSIPLDVCGADTQGATGYILSQAFLNVLSKRTIQRHVICVLTQALVDNNLPAASVPLTAIGPWFDRDKADQYRQTRGWNMIEDPGRGYRRAVPSYPIKEIVEIDSIHRSVEEGDVVIAGGGGGIPVVLDAQGEYCGIEAVVETEQLACLIAEQLKAKILLSIIESDSKFILSGLSTEIRSRISREEVDGILARDVIRSKSVQRILRAASRFLASGGEQVIITTLRKLPETLEKQSGLWIGPQETSVVLFQDG